MVPQILGVVIALAGIFLAAFAVLGVFNAHEMSVLIGMAADVPDSGSEASRWLRHWNLSCVVMLLAGLVLTVAGIGLFVSRRWSVLLLASVAVLLALQQIVLWVSGWARYAFEMPDPVEIAFLLLVAVASTLVFFRWRPVG